MTIEQYLLLKNALNLELITFSLLWENKNMYALRGRAIHEKWVVEKKIENIKKDLVLLDEFYSEKFTFEETVKRLKCITLPKKP